MPVVITAYDDKSFDFIFKTTPASNLLLKAANIEKGGKTGSTDPVATISVDEVRKIAEYKLPDLNTNNIDQAIKIIAGTARNMGIVVEGITPDSNAKKGK